MHSFQFHSSKNIPLHIFPIWKRGSAWSENRLLCVSFTISRWLRICNAKIRPKNTKGDRNEKIAKNIFIFEIENIDGRGNNVAIMSRRLSLKTKPVRKTRAGKLKIQTSILNINFSIRWKSGGIISPAVRAPAKESILRDFLRLFCTAGAKKITSMLMKCFSCLFIFRFGLYRFSLINLFRARLKFRIYQRNQFKDFLYSRTKSIENSFLFYIHFEFL